MHETEQFWWGIGYLLVASTATAVPVVVLIGGAGGFFW